MPKNTSKTKSDKKSDKKEGFVPGKLIGDPVTLVKGKSTIQVHHVTVDGVPMIDMRKYVKNDRYEGHTGQGFALPYAVFEAFREVIVEVELPKTAGKKTKK